MQDIQVADRKLLWKGPAGRKGDHGMKNVEMTVEGNILRACQNISVTNMLEEIWSSSTPHENHL